LAHLVSRWAVEQALARGCKIIYLEDLNTLEPKMNKWQNRRFNLAVKGKIKEYMIYKGQELGIKSRNGKSQRYFFPLSALSET